MIFPEMGKSTNAILGLNNVHLNLQMPLNRANCGILAVMAQLRNFNVQYLPIFFRHSFILFFCKTYNTYKVIN